MSSQDSASNGVSEVAPDRIWLLRNDDGSFDDCWQMSTTDGSGDIEYARVHQPLQDSEDKNSSEVDGATIRRKQQVRHKYIPTQLYANSPCAWDEHPDAVGDPRYCCSRLPDDPLHHPLPVSEQTPPVDVQHEQDRNSVSAGKNSQPNREGVIATEADGQSSLLPCPFCGSRNLSISDELDEDANWVVWCLDCKGGSTFCVEKSDAITHWNTRFSDASKEYVQLETVLQIVRGGFPEDVHVYTDQVLAEIQSLSTEGK